MKKGTRRRFSLTSLIYTKSKGSGRDQAKSFSSLNWQERMEETRRRTEAWRLEPPKDTDSPLTIRRNKAHMTKRVSFHDVWIKCDDDNTNTVTGDRTSNSGDDGEVDESSRTKSKSASTRQLITDVKSPPGTHNSQCHSYENINYLHEEVTRDRECFVTAFGQKGKQVGEFEDAKDITCITDGHLLITDMVLGRLQKFNNTAKSVTVIAPKEITHPWATAMTKDNSIAITLCKESRVNVFSEAGDVVHSFGDSVLKCPTGIACDANGRFIVCDATADQVLVFNSDGSFLHCLGNSDIKEERFSKPRYVCVSAHGDVIVSDSGNHKVKIFNSDGTFVKSIGSFGRSDGQFKCPYGVCTNILGEMFVADHYNSRICMFTRDGNFLRHIVTSDNGLIHPQGLAIDTSMHLYITHGHLKATEVLIFKLTRFSSSTHIGNDCIEMISHV